MSWDLDDKTDQLWGDIRCLSYSTTLSHFNSALGLPSNPDENEIDITLFNI